MLKDVEQERSKPIEQHDLSVRAVSIARIIERLGFKEKYVINIVKTKLANPNDNKRIEQKWHVEIKKETGEDVRTVEL